MITEIWKPIPDYPGYEVSSHGRFKNLEGNINDFSNCQQSTRRTIGIRNTNSLKSKQLHSVIAEVFIGPRPKGFVVNHKDRNPGNNNLSNLEYITKSENSRHWKHHKKPEPGSTVQIEASISQALNDELRKEAEGVNRSFSNYIAYLLINRQAVKEG